MFALCRSKGDNVVTDPSSVREPDPSKERRQAARVTPGAHIIGALSREFSKAGSEDRDLLLARLCFNVGVNCISIWLCEYQGRLPTCDLSTQAIAKLVDGISASKKAIFGRAVLWGHHCAQHVTGVFLINGEDINSVMAKHPSYRDYKWTRIDCSPDSEGWNTIRRIWCYEDYPSELSIFHSRMTLPL